MLRNLFQDASVARAISRRSIETFLIDKPEENAEQVEADDGGVEWTWDCAVRNDFVDFVNNNRDVKFHKNFSSGTAVVRGSMPMANDQYFWEVKMISPVYGTDMMIGVGTSEADVSQVHEKFISLLGQDKQTWGLSYTGLFHHDGISKGYAKRFGQGSTIGVHLDLWSGTLSFYRNRQPLGIASRGLKGKTLYAMASSTAACSGMRIVRTSSFSSSLQFLCCSKLREIIPNEKSVLKELDLPPGLRLFLQNKLDWLLDSHSTDNLKCQTQSEVPLVEQNSICPFHNLSVPSYNAIVLGSRRHLLREIRIAQPTMSMVQPLETVGNVLSLERAQLNSVDENTNSTEEQDASFQHANEDEDRAFGNEAKRRRCSYNYAIGLSDPDSD